MRRADALVILIAVMSFIAIVFVVIHESRLNRLEVIIDGVFSGGNKVEPK